MTRMDTAKPSDLLTESMRKRLDVLKSGIAHRLTGKANIDDSYVLRAVILRGLEELELDTPMCHCKH